MNEGIVECVININHNTDDGFISSLIDAVNNTGAKVAHCDSGIDAQRTVLTILSYVRYVPTFLDVIYAQCSIGQNINHYNGNHPSVGIVDVVPFVPIKNITKNELATLMDLWATDIANNYHVPIIYYGMMTISSNQRELNKIRKGGIKSATQRLKQGELHVNNGPHRAHRTLGISCWTVRDIMLAYNVSINTQDLSLIKSIAKQLRNLRDHYQPLQNVKILGWTTPCYECSQISANLYNLKEMTLEGFYDLIVKVASDYRVEIIGSELIGMTTRAGISNNLNGSNLTSLITKLGLACHKEFNVEDRLLELAIEDYENTHNSSIM